MQASSFPSSPRQHTCLARREFSPFACAAASERAGREATGKWMGPNYRISKTEDPPWQTLVWGARALTRSVQIHQPACQLSSPGVTAAAQPLRSAISKPVTDSSPGVISLTGLAIISPDGVQLGARRGPLWRELPKKASGEPEWSLDSRSR